MVAYAYQRDIIVNMKTISKNLQTTLDILRDEVRGDIISARKKMTDDYTMTWMYEKGNGQLFPRSNVTKDSDLDDAYPIKGRVYEIIHIAEKDNTVFVELIESYPDPDTKKVYRTPLVLVLEFEGEKIRTGRHYCDPKVSFLYLSDEETAKGYIEQEIQYIIKED